jgi:hypothetical protein
MNPGRHAVLLYRSTCGKCRVLSRFIVCLSLGWVQRVALLSPGALAMVDAYGLPRAKLALIGYGKAFTAWRTIPGIAVLMGLALRTLAASLAEEVPICKIVR